MSTRIALDITDPNLKEKLAVLPDKMLDYAEEVLLAQASTKTDDVAWEVFNEIKFKGKTDATMIYQTFNYGGGSTVPVRVTSTAVDGETLTVHLKRYSALDQASGTYSAYYGN